MKTAAKKPIIGILGGIASGKSAVAAEFEKLGCKVINADEIVHILLNKPDIIQKITTAFGHEILNEGRINNKALADAAFADPDKTCILNEIIHPQVFERTEQLINQYSRQEQVKAIVLDIPLLVETGWHMRCDRLIFVDSDHSMRLERAKSRGITEKQLELRENLQISLDYKKSIADNTVVNNSDFSALVKQVVNIFSNIK